MVQDFTPKKTQIVTGKDSIVISRYVAGLTGGRTLDVTGVAEGVDVIPAGTIIIAKNGTYKPLAISEGAYASLGEGEAYVGVLYQSVLKAKPAASIMTIGTVNEAACPAPFPAAFKTAVPTISLIKDEEA